MNVKTVTIATGASLSDAVNIENATMIGIIMPAAWTAANLTFQAAARETDTFANVYDDAGTEVSVTADASRAIPIGTDLKALGSFRYLKIRSGTAAVPVNQAAARVITLFLKRR